MSVATVEPSAAARAIAIRRRRDLVIERVVLRGTRCWHIKDPLTLKYWQFGEEEMFLWRQLDGTLSLSQWQEAFQQRFAPRRIEVSRLQDFLGMLHREGLVLSPAAGQAEILLARHSRQRTRSWLKTFSNVLAIRFRGVNPEPALRRIYPGIAWMFHPTAIAVSGLLVLSALSLLLVEWSQFTARLPAGQSFFTASGLMWLAIALAGTKVLHELGHALACKHFGGECHELGLMLLVFTPCLYCNVTDTWLVADKWRRIAVSAAGMYVEFLLAAMATWLWWLSEPGIFNALCLSVMVVCSVGTFLFNANPLLRYDGYFILSDLVETPNLGQEADSRVRQFFASLLFGLDEPTAAATRSQAHRRWLLVYGILSSVYRLVVVGLILWFFFSVLTAHRLELFAYGLAAMVVVGMVFPVAKRVGDALRQPRQGRKLSRPRIVAMGVVIVALAMGVLWVPIRRDIYAPASIRPGAATAVFVPVPGVLVNCVPAGTTVRRGDKLATLRNDELDWEIARLTGERNVLRTQLESLRRQRVSDPRTGVAGSSGQSTVVEQSLADAENQLQQRIEDSQKLVVTAPADGIVLSPPPLPDVNEPDELTTWGGTPLDPRNVGCYLETGTLLCHVGEAGKREAVVIVDQSHVEELQTGAVATLQLDELPGTLLDGKLAAISAINRRDPPADLAAKHRLPVQGAPGEAQLSGTFFEVLVTLSDETTAPFGSTGTAKISATPQTIARRTLNWLSRTFRFL